MNIGPAIRTALINNAPIASQLSVYVGDPAVFLKRPLPSEAKYPLIAISPDITYSDEDFLSSGMDSITRDIGIYGEQPKHFDLVEDLGHAVRKLFHRKPLTLASPLFHVVSIRAIGPIAAPTDDVNTVGRIVSLIVRIQENGS